MKPVLLFFILFISITSAFSQIIWKEDFQGLADGTTVDNGVNAWSTTQPSSGWFQVRTFNDGTNNLTVFAINDTGTEGVWTSEEIDISGYAEVSMEAIIGGYWASSSDYVKCYYILDGGPEVKFGEQVGLPEYKRASAASAIVSGSTLQIVIKGYENVTDTYYGFPRLMGFDDIVISEITYLYSRQSGNWTDGNSWSTDGYGGASCGCTPDQNTHVFVGNNKTIKLNTNGISAGLTVENTGEVRYIGNFMLNVVRGGAFQVDNGGMLNKNNMNSSSLKFSTYSYNMVVNGNVTLGNLNVDAANWNLSGTGSLTVGNDITFSNISGQAVTNDLNGTLSVGNLLFNSSSSDFTFINNETINISNQIRFDNDRVTIQNNDHLTANNGVYIVNNDDDDNKIINAGTLTLSNFNFNNADFILDNSGYINQTGNFSNQGGTVALNNLTGGTWNYTGTGTTTKFNTAAANNTFNYSRAGNQTISQPANGTYQNLNLSGTGTKTAGSNLDIDGNLSISGSQLDMSASSYNLNIGGNWTVTTSSDRFIERTGTVTFDGAGDQMIQAAQGVQAFYDLVIDKSSGSVMLSSSSTNLNITNSINLANGELNLNERSLNILNSNPAAVTRTGGYIKSETTITPYSTVKWDIGTSTGSYIFPMGKSSTEYIPFTFDVTNAGVGAGTVSLATYGTGSDNNPYPDGVVSLDGQSGINSSSDVVDRFWQIDLSGYSSNPTVSVTFTATPDEVGSLSAMKAQRWNNSTQSWDPALTGQSNPSAYSVTVPGVNTFSPWTLVDGNATLPVELTYFTAQLENDAVAIAWETAQEINNDYFTIEKTQDFKTFYEVKVVKGQGTSKEKNVYYTIDNNPLPGTSYYRLKQTDYDGAYEYFKAVKVDYKSDFVSFVLYPNPSNGQNVNLRFSGDYKGETIPLTILNSAGIEVYKENISSTAGFNGSFKIELPTRLTYGLYMVKVGDNPIQKLLIQN